MYLKKRQPCYVCIVQTPDRVYCAGAALSEDNAFLYCANTEQYFRRIGCELVKVIDTWEVDHGYVSYWEKDGEEYIVLLQISALMQ